MHSWLNWNLVLRRQENQSTHSESLSEEGREPTTNPTHKWRRCKDLNPGHITGRQELSCTTVPTLVRRHTQWYLNCIHLVFNKYVYCGYSFQNKNHLTPSCLTHSSHDLLLNFLHLSSRIKDNKVINYQFLRKHI